ncbi:MAG: hypothetical protein KF862_14985 [Chitinophagaceae bacterium]|nr:hypothetical protein [Chitinophagaceae bacterium]
MEDQKNLKEREQKIAFVQQQLNLLQPGGIAGLYGFETLAHLRNIIHRLCKPVTEQWIADSFVFSVANYIVCLYRCGDDSVEITVKGSAENIAKKHVYRYSINEDINWTEIESRIRNSCKTIGQSSTSKPG